MKSVEKCSVPNQPLEGFNVGMDVIKPLQGFGLRVYAPRISCGAIEIEALWASVVVIVVPNSRSIPSSASSLPFAIKYNERFIFQDEPLVCV